MDERSLPIGEELDPILLELGSALFVCQGLEGTLVFLLSVCSMEDAQMETGTFQAAMDVWSQKTLGQLLKPLRERMGLSEELAERFRAGWNCRNWIVHQFLRDTVEDFATPKGRLAILRRLADAKRTIKETDELANRILDAYVRRYGISLDDAKTKADLIWEFLNPKPSPTVN